MKGSPGGIRLVTPAEIAFRASEGAICLLERLGGIPRPDPVPGAPGVQLPEPLFPFVAEREAVVRAWRESFPRSVERTLDAADGILDNRIPVFSRTVAYGERIDWHLDPVSGLRAPLSFYRDIDTLDPAAIGDAKHIWEPNRHNFLLHLGRASWVTGDRRYFGKWRDVILSWIEENPYNRGINWESSLELAFRAINWIWSSWFFLRELEEDADLAGRIYGTLYLHGVHIRRHLSRYFSPNTHLTGEALGLLYIGRSYPAMGPSPEWVATGLDILERELGRQVLDDGGYFEMATYYHLYTLDFYVHYLMLAGGDRPDPRRSARICRSVRHLALLSEPDGTIPLLGDSDGGRLLMLGRSKRSVAGVCCTAAALTGDGELKALCRPEFDEEALWLLGTAGREAFERLPAAPPRHWHSINRETGLFCFRSGMNEADSYVIIDCGPHGWGSCGHAHADLLSFVWYCGGGMVVTDPGTFTYSGSKEIRDSSRGSAGHNTITIDGVSQSVPGGTFGWRKIASPKQADVRFDARNGSFTGEHDAYEDRGCSHRRTLLFFGGDLIVIVDVVGLSSAPRSLLCAFQFGDGTLHESGGGMYRFEGSGGGGSGSARFFTPPGIAVEIGEGAFYPDYGEAVRAPKIGLTGEGLSGRQTIVTLLSPDGRLLESFRLPQPGRLEGSSDSADYSIQIDGRGVEAFLNGKPAIPR